MNITKALYSSQPPCPNNNSGSSQPSLWLVLLHASILLIHLVCPAFSVDGYVCDVVNIKKPLTYRLNGLACLVISVAIFFFIHYYYSEESGESVDLFLSHNYMAGVVMSNVLGLIVSFYLVYVRFPSLSKVAQKANTFRRAPNTTLTTNMDDMTSTPTSIVATCTIAVPTFTRVANSPHNMTTLAALSFWTSTCFSTSPALYYFNLVSFPASCWNDTIEARTPWP